MFNNAVYLSSSVELEQARNIQLQISQKKLELQLLEINNNYSSGNNYPYTSYLLQKQTIESNISYLIYNRDAHLNSAIEYALMQAEQDVDSSNQYSMATVTISAINSFLRSQRIRFKPVFATQMRLSQLYYKTLNAGFMWNNLMTEISNLKVQCEIV